MTSLWLILVACVASLLTPAFAVPRYCGQPTSENTLGAVVEQLSRCQGRVHDLLRDLAPYLIRVTRDTIVTIDNDRDRTLAAIRDKYVHTSIADEAISTVVVQASQMATQFGDRKRELAFACVVNVRKAVLNALAEVQRLCGPCSDRAARAVLENVHYRVLRNLNLAIEWIRDYTETNIGVTSKGVLEVGKVALQLNDRVLTTEACNKSKLQQQLANAIGASIKRIEAIYNVNDDKIYAAVRDFSAYFQQAEEPRQAVNYYLQDSKTGIVKTQI